MTHNMSESNTTTALSFPEEDTFTFPVWMVIVMYILYTSSCLMSVGGNSIVIFLVTRYKKLHTVANMFILNLAVGDLLMALLCIPFGFVSTLLLKYWPFGLVMCVVVSYSQA